MRLLCCLLGGVAALTGCAPRLSTGAPCERADSCEAPLVCLLGRCRTECVSHRDCTLGGVCLLDQEGRGSCRLPEDERCVSNGECDGTLICVDGACANACTSVTECPEDSRCEAGTDGRTRCVRGDIPLDAGLDGSSDVSADDAADDAGVCAGPGCDPVIDVALTERSACAMTASGAVWCWGYSIYLGATATTEDCNDEADCATRPVRVQLIEDGIPERDLGGATSLAASLGHSCAVTDGRVACWGRMSSALGTVGDGLRARLVRSDAGGVITTATEVTVGLETALARLSDGSVVGWGRAELGEFGMGTETDRITASAAPALATEAPYSLGAWHGCSVVAHTARCWGEDDVGQASGILGTVINAPTAVAGVPEVIDVSPGRSSSCALTEAGDVWCWGSSLLVSDGVRTTMCANVCPPTRIFRAGLPFTRLARSPSAEEVCAIDTAGGLWCWGGRTRALNNDPHRIEGLPPIERAFVGSNATCAVDHTGEVWCWGDNEMGQLGRGTVSGPDFTPMRVSWTD